LLAQQRRLGIVGHDLRRLGVGFDGRRVVLRGDGFLSGKHGGLEAGEPFLIVRRHDDRRRRLGELVAGMLRLAQAGKHVDVVGRDLLGLLERLDRGHVLLVLELGVAVGEKLLDTGGLSWASCWALRVASSWARAWTICLSPAATASVL